MFFFRIIRHFSYFRSYRKPGFEYPEVEAMETTEETEEEATDEQVVSIEADTQTPETSSDVAGDMLVLENETENRNLAIEVTEEQEQEVQVTEEPKEKDPLHLELEEEGFEILDLDDIAVDVKSTKKVTETMVENK